MSHDKTFLYFFLPSYQSAIVHCTCLMTWHLCWFIFISHCLVLADISRFFFLEKWRIVKGKKEKWCFYWDLSSFLSSFARFKCSATVEMDGQIGVVAFMNHLNLKIGKKNLLAQFSEKNNGFYVKKNSFKTFCNQSE